MMPMLLVSFSSGIPIGFSIGFPIERSPKETSALIHHRLKQRPMINLGHQLNAVPFAKLNRKNKTRTTLINLDHYNKMVIHIKIGNASYKTIGKKKESDWGVRVWIGNWSNWRPSDVSPLDNRRSPIGVARIGGPFEAVRNDTGAGWIRSAFWLASWYKKSR